MLEAYKKWTEESGSAEIVKSWPKPPPEFNNEVECANPILVSEQHLISMFLKHEYPKILGYRTDVTYPSPAIHDNFHNVEWNPHKLRSCKKGSWINDEIVNSGILSAITFAESSLGELVLFLRLGFFDSSNQVDKKMKYMKNWKIDWASKINSLLIPINHNNTHWTLMVVYPRLRRILHFDSIKSNNSIPDEKMVKFLLDCFEAAANMYSWEYDSKSEWTVGGIEKVPHQSDSNSCGIRVLLNCELVIWKLPLTLQAYDEQFVNKVWQYIGVAIVRKKHWLTGQPSLRTT